MFFFSFLSRHRYAIGGSETEWEGALSSGAAAPGSTISVASSDKKKEQHREYLKNKADGAQKRALAASDKGQGSAKKKKH